MLIFIRYPAVLALAFGIAAASAADLTEAVTTPPTLIIPEPVLTSPEIAALLPAPVLVRPAPPSGSGPADFLDALRSATGRPPMTCPSSMPVTARATGTTGHAAR